MNMVIGFFNELVIGFDSMNCKYDDLLNMLICFFNEL